MASRMKRPSGVQVALFVAMGTALTVPGSAEVPPSTCFGTPKKGALKDGVKLPLDGANFRAYGELPWKKGRTYVHSTVHAIILESYADVAKRGSPHRFVYGETGWKKGGRIKPHRTHQNGLSVDYMVPVRDAAGQPAQIPTTRKNRFGYDVNFDSNGASGKLRIDFEAIADHLASLKRAAATHNVRVAKVIFDPKLRRRLEKTKWWSEIKDLPFTKNRVWVRHDEHYHVDFAVPCEPMSKRRAGKK